MGLIARAIETAGIPTVSVTITRDLTESVGVPRALFVRWPLGHPLGEAHKPLQQRTVIFDALKLLLTTDEPGVIAEPGYRWRREIYSEPMWKELEQLLTDHPAKWMIWEDDAMPETVERLKTMGIDSVVFDPCGNVPPDGEDYLSVMDANARALARVFDN